MKKTKIICTMGPNTMDEKLLREMIHAGMDVARFNFSHGTYESHKEQLQLLKRLREETGVPVAAMRDTKGPEIRTGMLEGGTPVKLQAGEKYVLTTREILGNDKICSISYDGLPEDVKEGDRILIDDGLIELTVEKIKKTDIFCRIYNGGELGQRKGVNVPGIHVRMPDITEKDREDILFGIEQGFDFIAASFVRSADCVLSIRQILREHNSKIQIIAKIENREGVENLTEILEVCDGIMIARGDMGVEIPPEDVPSLQKEIIRKCNEACRPVITATQMLDSMIRNPRPTRAEVGDVANAIYDGTDVIMLSGETAMGKYPLEAVRMMARIAVTTEAKLDYPLYQKRHLSRHKYSQTNMVCRSSVLAAAELSARAILAPTLSGYTCRMLSKWRAQVQVIGLTPNEQVLRQMQIYWGVRPVQICWQNSVGELVARSLERAKELDLAQKGDLLLFTSGVLNSPDGQVMAAGKTNMMRILEVD